jgi:Fe-S oxidoreductase
MCPTFVATGEEIMSTRGRANTIRAVLEGRGLEGGDPLSSVELEAALSNCLSCKACSTECPSNVNLALLKAELVQARHRRDGRPLRARVLSHVDLLGRLGCLAPGLANAALEWRWLRWLMLRMLGISRKRSLPRYATQRFDRWFAGRGREVGRLDAVFGAGRDLRAEPAPGGKASPSGVTPPPARVTRGKVTLWDDCFVRYHEPHIGRAAVKVLEAAGFEVVLPRSRQCCGRPAFSQGNLDEAARLGRHNLRLLTAAGDRGNAAAETPVLFLEPSCYAMFAEDYGELRLPGAERVAQRSFLFEQFMEDLLGREPDALPFNFRLARVAIHAHCHAKSLLNPVFMERLAARLPGRQAMLLETGCCGMAGAFGALESKYELSRQVGELLAERIRGQPAGTIVVASGTSCRQQIQHLVPVRPRHMAELLAEALSD